MNSITYSGNTVSLPDDLDWPDEFAWSPVTQKTEYSLTGSLIVDIGVRSAGRQITLRGDADTAWSTREVAAQLQAWAALGGAQMTLMLRGAPRTVMFDHERTALEWSPLQLESYSDPLPTDRGWLVLRFLEL
jgi:hypothetical protein